MYEWYALSFTVENTGLVNFMFTSFFGSISILNSLWNSPRYISIPLVDHPLLFSPNVKSEIDGICRLDLWIQREPWMVGRIFQKCPITVKCQYESRWSRNACSMASTATFATLQRDANPCAVKKKRRQSLSREHDQHILSTRARTRHEKENNQEHNQEYSYSLLASHFFPFFLFLNWSKEWIGNLGTCNGLY